MIQYGVPRDSCTPKETENETSDTWSRAKHTTNSSVKSDDEPNFINFGMHGSVESGEIRDAK